MVLELLSGDQTLAQVATKHEVTPISLKAWKKQFLENASMAFDVGKATQSFKEEIATLKNENDALAKKLGKTTIERDWAVGKLKSYSLAQAASRLSAALLSPSRLRYTPARGA